MILRPPSAQARKAAQLLTLATLFWGLSFPLMKAIELVDRRVAPDTSSWFAASSTMTLRFGLAGVVTLFWSWHSLRQLTALELWEGFGLGLFTGLGMLLQMDGLAYTTASTSAFLTQSYCLVLPGLVAMRQRQRPPRLLLGCSLLVISGVIILAEIDWHTFKMGRGEIETLLSSGVFGGQILWLERPVFVRNRVRHFTLVMFVTMGVICLISSLGSMQQPAQWRTALTSPEVLIMTAVLVTLCTLVAFVLMNRWQPCISAPEAALIYAAEPVFASLFALSLPQYLSRWAGIDYPNEHLTANLLVGGGLITLANVLVQMQAARRLPQRSPLKLWGVPGPER